MSEPVVARGDSPVPGAVFAEPEPSVSHGGWPTAATYEGLSFSAPQAHCPTCALAGEEYPTLRVAAVTTCGGRYSLIWHMVCVAGHFHHYPATDYGNDDGS